MMDREGPWEWLEKALCTPGHGFDPDLWSEPIRRVRSEAIHICQRHCTAIERCALIPPSHGTVLAGVAYGEWTIARPLRHQPVPARSCKICAPELDTPGRGIVDLPSVATDPDVGGIRYGIKNGGVHE